MNSFCEHNYSKPYNLASSSSFPFLRSTGVGPPCVPCNLAQKKNVFQCHICPSVFKHHASLYKHLKRTHKVKNFGANNIKCREEKCHERFNRLSELEAHLNKKHMKKIERQKLSFGSLDEFKIWKAELEGQTESEYVTYSPGSTNTTLYFKCSRSGFYKERLSNGTRKRRLKAQGSKKSGAHCTSRMVVHVNEFSGAISVDFCKTHYGHNVELSHVDFKEFRYIF